MDFIALAQQCAPATHPATLAAIVRTESSFNPFAIGVVGGRLERQPRNLVEAVATAKMLLDSGWNASFGLGQVNKVNLAKYDLDLTSVFDPCKNLKAASAIFNNNYHRARPKAADEQHALRLALSEYYSGNYTTGFKHGYVQKVVENAAKPIPVIPTAPNATAAAASSSAMPALAAKGSAPPAPAVQVSAKLESEPPAARSAAFVFGDAAATNAAGEGESAFVFTQSGRLRR